MQEGCGAQLNRDVTNCVVVKIGLREALELFEV
jgi:hypothetical protein